MALPKTAPVLMGIVNVTPDSFSDGGQFHASKDAVAHGLRLVGEGAHILDIGGESTRPGAAHVSEQEELDRVLPVIEGLAAHTPQPLSIDTRKPRVAEAAVQAGAHIWNDVSALTYAEDSVSVAAKLNVPLILMHAQGDPKTMQDAPQYDDVAGEVTDFLKSRVNVCREEGISPDNIVLDPGIGFGKTLEHNIALLRQLDALVSLGHPVLLGASRKRFIADLDRDGPAGGRLGGSIAAAFGAAKAGVAWFRVHDVAATRQAFAVGRALHLF
ncbi:MAG: dihydropteroate synthase [Pseudomonadota bacterium]